MEKEFVPYDIALALKELGFDELCFGLFDMRGKFIVKPFANQTMSENEFGGCSAPLYQQAFRWFREKYNLKSCIMFRTSMEDNKEYYDWLIKGQEVVYRHFNTYEEAELECLKQLIEIVKKQL